MGGDFLRPLFSLAPFLARAVSVPSIRSRPAGHGPTDWHGGYMIVFEEMEVSCEYAAQRAPENVLSSPGDRRFGSLLFFFGADFGSEGRKSEPEK